MAVSVISKLLVLKLWSGPLFAYAHGLNTMIIELLKAKWHCGTVA
jgi:hypothetical protein